MGKTAKQTATAISCTHKHGPQYDMCLGCKIKQRAAKRVAAGGPTTEQLREQKLAQARATVARADAPKPKASSNGHSNGKATGEVAALRAEVGQLTGIVTSLVKAMTALTSEPKVAGA